MPANSPICSHWAANLAHGCKCLYCDNRHQLKWESKCSVKLKANSSPGSSPPITALPTSTIVAILVARLDSTSAMAATHQSVLTADQQFAIAYTVRLGPRASNRFIIQHTPVQARPKMAKAWLSLWSGSSLLSISLCLYLWLWLSVISLAAYGQVDSAARSYSQYYPPYITNGAASSQTRVGKNGRMFAKSSSVNAEKRTLPVEFSGGQINGVQVLKKTTTTNWDQLMPDYRITSDIIIPTNSRLEVESGVRVAFHSGVGIIVRGALVANGTSSSKVVFTSIDANKWPAATVSTVFDVNSPTSKPVWPNIRLVDGSSIHEGRLQIHYKGHWHSLCTNSRNWTQVDVNVVCGQLGFADGHWYRWFTRNNDTRQFMFENPACKGNEHSIQDCPNWAARRVGSGVCDFHQDIGIRCSLKVANNGQNRQSYWRGIDFYYSDSQVVSILSNKMEITTSRSYLEHVVVEYAGHKADYTYCPALNVLGSVPPYINELTIRRSANTALNITDPVNGFHISNSHFIENRGYGVYINSSVGRVLFSGVEIERNGADGVRFVHFNKPFYSTDSFCQTPNLGRSQVFPIRYTHKQSASKAPTEECCQEFYARDWEGQRITAHFPVLMSGIEHPDPRMMGNVFVPLNPAELGHEGSIYVVDGHSGRVIADFFIRNETRTQSVSSVLGNGPLRICYRPAQYRKVIFTVEVVIDNGREFDLVVAESRVIDNNGRGIWIQKSRSGTVVNRTFVAGHDYVAGIHFSDGVGEVIVNNSIITNNLVDGVNVTTGGGYLHLDSTELINNTGRAMAFWFNESIALQAFNQSSHVTRCTITNNRLGLLIYSGCNFRSGWSQNAYWNISMNMFNNQREQAILLQSCIPRPRILKMQLQPSITNVSISHNRFVANGFQAIHAAPLFFAKLSIIHNEFTQHTKAVLYVNSRDSFDVNKFVKDAERFPFTFSNDKVLTSQRNFALDSWPTSVLIRNNHFHRNRGYYVASVGLLEPESLQTVNFNSLSQKVHFTRNLLADNHISEPFPQLNSRSKVAAVLCVTSSNVLIWRNEFVNPESSYELGMHHSTHYRVVNASLNYWGSHVSAFQPNILLADKNLHSAAHIYERIFDRKNRYNLAQVEFFPYILIPHALESDRESLSQVDDREKISQFFTVVSSSEIGGQVRGQVNLPPGTYNVKRDIYVSPEGELVLNAGTELYFDQSVGIFVQGKFKAKGSFSSEIKFILATAANRKVRRDTTQEKNNSKMKSTKSNRTISNIAGKPTAAKLKLSKSASFSSLPIRLSNITEGRLEVKIGLEWGTVCGYNFDIEDAAVACHQLGLVLNKRDWRLEKSEFWTAGNARSIVMSNVQCGHLDTDFTQCRAERATENDFEGDWCPMGEVGIRCYSPAWAGIRFGMLTQEAYIEKVTVEKAGLLDYRTRQFVPALQFDFNRFAIRNSTIQTNIDSGIGLLWNDVLSEPNDDKLQIINSKVIKNLNHGIVTRTQGIQVKDCLIAENKASGFNYEPTFSREEQEELTSWVVQQIGPNRRISVLTIPNTSKNSGGQFNSLYNQSILLEHIGKQLYIYVPRRPNPSPSPFRILINTEVGKRIGVMAISPIFQTRSTETLRLYSPQLESGYIPKMNWDLRRNLTAFPFVYPGYRLVLEYSTGSMPYGGILLLFTPKQYLRSVPGAPTIGEQEEIEQQKMNSLLIFGNQIVDNGRGITASHCSMNVDFNGSYCKRYGNETIRVERNLIVRSKGAGLFVNSYAFSSTIPYSLMMDLLDSDSSNNLPRQEYDPSLTPSIVAEINYTLIDNQLANNADFGSIVLYDHSLYENGDLQRSSLQLLPGYLMSSAIGTNYPSNTNLFHWHIYNCTMESNSNGGLDIRLPYTWLYNENFTHTVVVRNSRFVNNHNFEFVVGGHYAKVNITGNRFTENNCKRGLASITGMEKLMRIEDNEMLNNYVKRYVLELNMASHADKFGTVHAYVRRNVLRNNRYAGPYLQENGATNEGYSPETYAIAIRGVQQVNVTRNILVNRNLQFELLAGVRAGSLNNELDARENWWGVTSESSAIRERIFDFDDWNSFASTLFSPWLSTDHIDAPLSYERLSPLDELYLNMPYVLGGRLTKSTVLIPRDRPYVVNADLTVMPGTTLTIRPGVEIEFYPSVGILVLGEMAAIGLQNSPITLRPLRRKTNAVVKNSRTGEEDISFRLGTGDSRNKRLAATQPQAEQLVFSKSDIGGIRLCLTETCEEQAEREADLKMERTINSLEDSGYPKQIGGRRLHGFLEIYNTTTLQWSPVCDTRFTERNAQVVCRQLGFPTLNAFVRRGPRLDMDPTLISRINHWPDALECIGNEATLSDCDLRTFSKDSGDKKSSTYESAPFVHSFNQASNTRQMFPKAGRLGYLYDNRTQEVMFYHNEDWTILEERSSVQSTACKYDGNEFVYIFCGQDNNNEGESEFASEHWGGVRFALPAFEEIYRPSANSVNRRRFPISTMQHVNIIGAGVLHGEKNAAVQMVQRSVSLEFVNVERSASHGIEVIAPPDSLSWHQLQVRNNLGSGLNLLLLGASSSESQRVPYQPLGDGPSHSVPYNAFSLVDICDARKELRVGEKVIVYYKYDNRPVDCVKIFTSTNPLKRIGLRFLQLNLWSAFVEPEGRTDARKDDYLQGRKFMYQREDIFHNNFATFQPQEIDLSLLNSMSDSIIIWDGDIFNETTRRLLGELYSDSASQMFQDTSASHNGPELGNERMMRNSRYVPPSTKMPPVGSFSSGFTTRLYKSTGFSLSMQLHASGASARYGFIAEISTLPSAYYADQVERSLQHNITYSEIKNNTGGALLYRSVGESVPPLALMHNVISQNCRHCWANFSTCESSSVYLQMQNSRNFYFMNNLLSSNRAGGLKVEATSFTAVSALKADIVNNLFAGNMHREALYFEGAEAGHSYQTIHADRNYFTRNWSPHRSNLVFGRAVVKFRENTVINNYGDSQMFVAGFAHAQSSSSLQHCTRNFFYNNRAVNERGEQSTIIVSTVGQVYTDNYLVNPENNFELATRNRTIMVSSNLYPLRQSILEPTAVAAVLASAIVQAPYNWWGFNETSAVEARIRDSSDYFHLIPVEFKPFYTGNWSVLSGSCYGGYEKIADTCFVYVGGRTAYHEARRFCEKDNSSMPFVRAANQAELTRYIYLRQPFYNRRRHPVWVQSFDVPIGSCSVLVDGYIREHDCNDELPFLCERDPEIGISTATLDYWYQEPLGIASIVVSLITAILSLACICCWICKSRHRHLEKLERRNSIRASIRSSRSLASMNTINSDANYITNRKLLHNSANNVSTGLTLSNGHSIPYRTAARMNGNPNGNHHQKVDSYSGSISTTPSLFADTHNADMQMMLPAKRFDTSPRTSNIFDEPDIAYHSNGQQRNSNLNLIMRPTFDLMYENQAFKGQSTPMSPASFSSHDSNQLQRAWTPDTNSTLDFKVKPSIEQQELSQYTVSTDNLHKSPASSATSSHSSGSTSPTSIISRSSQLPNQPLVRAPIKGKPTLRAPVHPPPPPPVRRSMRSENQSAQYRKSMDPNLLLAEIDSASRLSSRTPDKELLTFGAKKPLPIDKRIQRFTDLDTEAIGGSQPSLIYGSYGVPGSVTTQGSNIHYLETSLDGDSVYNEQLNQQPKDKHHDPGAGVGIGSPKSRLYASQPLETAM